MWFKKKDATCGDCKKPLPPKNWGASPSKLNPKILLCATCSIFESKKLNPQNNKPFNLEERVKAEQERVRKKEETRYYEETPQPQYYKDHCDFCETMSRNILIDEDDNKICGECRENPNHVYEKNPCDKCGSSKTFFVNSENEKICRKCGGTQSSAHEEKDEGIFRYIDEDDSVDEDEFFNEKRTTIVQPIRNQEIEEQEKRKKEEERRIKEEQEKLKIDEERHKKVLEDLTRTRMEKERIEQTQKKKTITEGQEKQQPIQEQEKSKNKEKILDSMVGMKNIKATLTEWLEHQEAIALLQSKSKIKVPNTSKNIVITGNPGVGKTMLAEKIASVLLEAGFITEDKFVPVKAEELVGQYVGHTAKKTTDKINEAKNGVFFLDEAYRLSGGNFSGSKGSFGLEAIETIMGYMDNPKNNTVFIFAGYEDKMQEFLDANEGFRSRVQEPFRLTDYTLEELTQIGINALQEKNYNTSQIKAIFPSYIRQNMKQGILIGNGRTVTQYVNKITEKHLLRIKKNPNTENYELLLPEDVKNAFETAYEEQEGLKEIFIEAKKKINELIGMKAVKQEVERLGNFQFVQNQRKKAGLQIEKQSHHMTFLGNAGTGKTTMARLIGEMFRGAGVLTNGHFVEVTKDMLTAGESIPKTVKSIVEKAKGGILFIDEAYSLANDRKGKEALDALIPLLENYRDDFICVFAGYEEDMQHLFQLNQGLVSRIPNHFHFENYNAEELMQMMLIRIKKKEYHLAEGAEKTLSDAIQTSVEQNIVTGNGRWIRNFFEKMLMSQNNRLFKELGKELVNEKSLDATDFTTITSEDILESLSIWTTTNSESNK